MVDNVNQVIGVINTANVGQTIWLTESNRPDPIRSDPIVRFIYIVVLSPQVQMVQFGKWRSVEKR
ncbi:hypothetical protein T4E_7625 [Trichinella pseudospiralis]|uniref:Uncharacterized protein n=1 Tax=Trichinella pseudospiralis TaxID=6337 RepID=A0A0V0XZP4_TRIPS|nr:hypothetical protein T4E_7625 [Trichinella pseudospiralis]